LVATAVVADLEVFSLAGDLFRHSLNTSVSMKVMPASTALANQRFSVVLLVRRSGATCLPGTLVAVARAPVRTKTVRPGL
jgi:hypothetical protein